MSFIPPTMDGIISLPPPSIYDKYNTLMKMRNYFINELNMSIKDTLRESIPMLLAIVNEIKDTFAHNHELFMSDKAVYGMYPGTQVFYGGGFGLSFVKHHGIYVGLGIVAELSSPSCPHIMANQRTNSQVCFGISTLQEFDIRAWKLNAGGMGVVMFPELDEETPRTALMRIQRLIDILDGSNGGWIYGILRSNCQHASNMVSTGACFSPQASLSNKMPFEMVTLYPTRTSPAMCDDACDKAYTTTDGCRCVDVPTRDMTSYIPYLSTPSYSCTVDPTYRQGSKCKTSRGAVDINAKINSVQDMRSYCRGKFKGTTRSSIRQCGRAKEKMVWYEDDYSSKGGSNK